VQIPKRYKANRQLRLGLPRIKKSYPTKVSTAGVQYGTPALDMTAIPLRYPISVDCGLNYFLTILILFGQIKKF
jgi:hypothetical protein